MIEGEVKIDGLTDLLEKLQALDTKGVKSSLRKAVKAGGKVFKDEIILRTPVRTGQLRDDIINATASDPSGGTATASAGPTIHSFYGEFAEFGTSHQPAKPFMRPAFDSKADEALTAFIAVLNEAVEKAAQ